MNNRLMGLILKEARQILRDKHLLFLLLFPPTIQLLLLGAALDPGVRNLSMGVVDHCRTAMSREFISSITSGGAFKVSSQPLNDTSLQKEIEDGKVNVGLVVPENFDRHLRDTHKADVQVIIDGIDAYTASEAGSYVMQSIQQFHPGEDRLNTLVQPVLTTLFNPALKSSWYFIPGIMGAMLTLTSTLVSSAALLKEKELGTLEQLLMTPYSVWEILAAKITPIFFLLMADAFIAVLVGMFVFSVPFRGNVFLFALSAALYVCVGMGLGMMLATVCKTERQSHLVSFFVNIPVMQLSGALVPLETMPNFLKDLSVIDPLRYFTTIARSVLLKGASAEMLYANLVILLVSACALFLFSVVRFRRQLS